MKYLNIFDLDFTILDSKHRSRFIDNKLDIEHWNNNNNKEYIYKDTLIPNMSNILYYCLSRNDFYNVIITSREISEIDKNFLNELGIFPDFFLHRGSKLLFNNFKDRYKLLDYELKDILLNNFLILNKFKIGFGFDDNPKNLEVFKKYSFIIKDVKEINKNILYMMKVLKEINKKEKLL